MYVDRSRSTSSSLDLESTNRSVHVHVTCSRSIKMSVSEDYAVGVLIDAGGKYM